ncbi:hypothetical protein OB13_01125 [Pontibacter sp. HJ8]
MRKLLIRWELIKLPTAAHREQLRRQTYPIPEVQERPPEIGIKEEGDAELSLLKQPAPFILADDRALFILTACRSKEERKQVRRVNCYATQY